MLLDRDCLLVGKWIFSDLLYEVLALGHELLGPIAVKVSVPHVCVFQRLYDSELVPRHEEDWLVDGVTCA